MNTENKVPSLGGEFNNEELRANFNAVLYLLTENMAVSLRLMEVLVDKGVATPEELNEKVLGVTGDKDALASVYTELFNRFVGYYASIKQMIEDGSYFAPAENVAQKPEDTSNAEEKSDE